MPTPIVIRDPNLDQQVDPPQAPRGTSAEHCSSQSFRNNVQTRNGDISTSPRFLGYIFSFFSSAVLLASSVMFYVRGVYPTDFNDLKDIAEKNGITMSTKEINGLQARYDSMNFSSKLFFTSGGIVTQNYQVYGSIAVSALLTVITMVVLFAHLDSFCCPNYFRHFFRDGSKSERNLILALTAISAISLQICTSRFSIGEAQINVFFSTWTNFISCALNFEVWRNSAGRHSTFQNILFDKAFPLKRHWFILSIFTTISFLSLIDYFLTTRIFANKIDAQCPALSWNNKWVWMSLLQTILTWGTFSMSRKMWKQRFIELLTSWANLIMSAFVIANLTGGRLDDISCPSNLYFSVWASFFTSVWIVSMLLETWNETSS